MSLGACDAKLSTATRELSNRWSQTSAEWRDQKRDEFDRTYMMELQACVESARRAMGELAEVIAMIRKDCE